MLTTNFKGKKGQTRRSPRKQTKESFSWEGERPDVPPKNAKKKGEGVARFI